LEPGNTSVEDELARLVWAEKKAQVSKRHLYANHKRESKTTRLPPVETTGATRSRQPISSPLVQTVPVPKSQPLKPLAQPTKSIAATLKESHNPRLIEELNSVPASQSQSSKPRIPAMKSVPPNPVPTPDPPPTQSAQPYPKGSPTNVTLASLEKILRQTTASPENMHLLHHTLFNLDTGRISTIFGKFGFDSTFLVAFLDAILAMQSSGTNWVDQSIALLEAVRRCGRFNIAVTFAPADKILRVFDVLRDQATSRQRPQLDTVKSMWIK
jgi:hypothetical protein